MLGSLGSSDEVARSAYRRFMNEAPAGSDRLDLSPTARTGRTKRPDRDLLVTSCPMSRTLMKRSLEVIAAGVADQFHLPLDELRSHRRRPDLVRARGEIARRALLEGAANLSQVARYLNRAPSTLSDLLHGRRRIQDVETVTPAPWTRLT